MEKQNPTKPKNVAVYNINKKKMVTQEEDTVPKKIKTHEVNTYDTPFGLQIMQYGAHVL